MAKTYKNLFPQIYSFESLHAAYVRARAGKREHADVQRFELDLEGNLIQLQNELIWGEYQMGSYFQFKVFEPKERNIASLPFRDRVVQHALVAAIEPIWERRFIADSYACRVNKGTHRGADRAQAILRKVKREHGKVFVFKADIAKYFPSINHEILKRLLRKHIACKQTLALLDQIIDSANSTSNIAGVGMPIGNLTSQLCANIYLHELDCFVKHGLREPLYVRYVDDFIIAGHNKAHLQQIRVKIESFLAQHLHLKTNSKTQIYPIGNMFGRALDFLGYRIWPTHRRIRKNSVSRIKLSLSKLRRDHAAGLVTWHRIRQSLQSWIAHAMQADTFALRSAVLKKFVFCRSSI